MKVRCKMCECLDKVVQKQAGTFVNELLGHLIRRLRDFDEGVRSVAVQKAFAIGMSDESLLDKAFIDALVDRVVDTQPAIRLQAIESCLRWFGKYVTTFWGENSGLPFYNTVFLSIIPKLVDQFHRLDLPSKF
ncbi:hypothetical protein RFI_33721, partial [Reticulomyxa filosa]